MPIDPSIYNMVGKFPQIEVPDPLERQTRLAQLKQLAMQGEMGQMQLGEAKAKQAKVARVNALLSQHGGDVQKAAQAAKAAGDYETANELQTMLKSSAQTDAIYQKSVAEWAEAKAKLTKAERENVLAGLQDMDKGIRWVKEVGPEERPSRWATFIRAYPPEVREKYGLSDEYNENAAGFIMARARAVNDDMKPTSDVGKIMTDWKNGAYGSGPESIKLRDMAIKKATNIQPSMMAIMGGAGAGFDPTKPLPDIGMEAIAAAIARKEQPPQEYSVRNPAGKMINARAAALGEGEIMGKGAQATRQAGIKDFEPQGTSGKTISALNTMTEHLATGRRLAQALENGDTPAINRLSQGLGIQMGSDKATNFQTLKQFLAGEVAKVATGGHITEGEIHAAAARLNEAGSPKQILGALDIMREIAAGKLVALDQDYKRLTGKTLVEGKRLTPATEQAFKDLGAKHGPATKVLSEAEIVKLPPAVALAYKSGKAIKGPDGTVYKKGE